MEQYDGGLTATAEEQYDGGHAATAEEQYHRGRAATAEEQYHRGRAAKGKISVWWDMESCHVPEVFDAKINLMEQYDGGLAAPAEEQYDGGLAAAEEQYDRGRAATAEEQYHRGRAGKGKISVWWDMESCHVPEVFDAKHISLNRNPNPMEQYDGGRAATAEEQYGRGRAATAEEQYDRGRAATAEEQYHRGRATTVVWWDMDSCHVPEGFDPKHISQTISSTLDEAGYKGAVAIRAYWNGSQITSHVLGTLNSSGISLIHVAPGEASNRILTEMLLWQLDNPPPATYLLISGGCFYSYGLHRLSQRGYKILLAHPEKVSPDLDTTVAKSVWLWTSLLAGGAPLPASNRGRGSRGESSLAAVARDGVHWRGGNVKRQWAPRQGRGST